MRTASWLPALRADLRYAWWSRHVLGVVVLSIGFALIATKGLADRVAGAYAQFLGTQRDSAAQGITLAQALSQPVVVHNDGSGQVVENVLRYDFEAARTAISSLSPVSSALNALQFTGMAVMPAVAVVIGIVMATRDDRFKTIRWRGVQRPLGVLHASGFITSVLVCAGGLLVGAATAAAAVVPWGAATRTQLDPTVFGTPAAGTPVSDLLVMAGVSLGLVVFFCAVGTALGLMTRRTLVPVLAFVVWNYLCPLLGSYDPRSLWLSVITKATDYVGSFAAAPPSGHVPLALAAVVLTVGAVALLAVGHSVSRRSSHWGADGMA